MVTLWHNFKAFSGLQNCARVSPIKCHPLLLVQLPSGTRRIPVKQLKVAHNGSASETAFKWRLAGGSIEARFCVLTGILLDLNLLLVSYSVRVVATCRYCVEAHASLRLRLSVFW